MNGLNGLNGHNGWKDDVHGPTLDERTRGLERWGNLPLERSAAQRKVKSLTYAAALESSRRSAARYGHCGLLMHRIISVVFVGTLASSAFAHDSSLKDKLVSESGVALRPAIHHFVEAKDADTLCDALGKRMDRNRFDLNTEIAEQLPAIAKERNVKCMVELLKRTSDVFSGGEVEAQRLAFRNYLVIALRSATKLPLSTKGFKKYKGLTLYTDEDTGEMNKVITDCEGWIAKRNGAAPGP